MGDYGQHPGYTEHYFRLCTKEKKGIHSTESENKPWAPRISSSFRKAEEIQEWAGGGQEVGRRWAFGYKHLFMEIDPSKSSKCGEKLIHTAYIYIIYVICI